MSPAGAIFLTDPRALRPLWDDEVDGAMVCRAVRPETRDVTTFVLSAEQPHRFAFQAGQFLTFDIEVDGVAFQRCYTIASPPTRPDLVSITVKRVPGGPVSNWLHDRLRVGMTLGAQGPMGDFTWAAHPADKSLLLSAGSGITPLMSMARAHHDLASGADIVFVHSARSPGDIIFADELALMARAGLRVAAICETDPGGDWDGPMGRLDPGTLLRIAPDLLEREVFVCGPAPYMDAVRAILVGLDFDLSHHHQESFDFDDLALSQTEAPARSTSGTGFSVTFSQSGQTIACGADDFVLAAAQRAGLRLPFACAKGMCGTCKSRLVSGQVEMNHAGGIRQREIDQGLILLCCSRPVSDLVVER